MSRKRKALYNKNIKQVRLAISVVSSLNKVLLQVYTKKELKTQIRVEWIWAIKCFSVFHFCSLFLFYDKTWRFPNENTVEVWETETSSSLLFYFTSLKGKNTVLCFPLKVCRLFWPLSSPSRKSFFFCCLSLKSAPVWSRQLLHFSSVATIHHLPSYLLLLVHRNNLDLMQPCIILKAIVRTSWTSLFIK